MALNQTEFNLNLIMKTDEIIKSWNLIKKLFINDEYILSHPDYDFEAFDAIDSNIEAFKDEMEMCVVGELNYVKGKKELNSIRSVINDLTGDQVEMISVSDVDTEAEKAKAKQALEAAFDNMRSKGAKIEQVFSQGE